jgi:hypothetical protein
VDKTETLVPYEVSKRANEMAFQHAATNDRAWEYPHEFSGRSDGLINPHKNAVYEVLGGRKRRNVKFLSWPNRGKEPWQLLNNLSPQQDFFMHIRADLIESRRYGKGHPTNISKGAKYWSSFAHFCYCIFLVSPDFQIATSRPGGRF